MADRDATTLEMALCPGTWGTSRTELFDPADDPDAVGPVLKVLANSGTEKDAVSTAFVDRVSAEFPSLLRTSEDEEGNHDLHLHFDLCYGGLRTHMAFMAWLDRGDTLGSTLPVGIDVEIGSHTIKGIRLAMRRAYLTDRANGFHPVFAGRDFHVDPDFVFVLMPFTEAWSDRIWSRHIKPTVDSMGLSCKRADDFFAPGVIIDDIWAAINCSSVIIADLTGRNPNVFYELGIAHVVGVPAILLSQDHEVPAFDTAHYRQIRYQDNSEGCELLENQLRAALTALFDKIRFP